MDENGKYKLVEGDGITAAIVHRQKVLLVKRVNIPIISNPGIWTFVMGKRNKNETHIETAYREIEEEVRLGRVDLEPILQLDEILMFDAVRKKKMWKNSFFIFKTHNPNIRINYENTHFRWAQIEDLEEEREYTNIFINKESVLSKIKEAIER
ncbi:MAG: NUDIX domain-containing protein [Candidatus Micrarchaeota archaeon]|nr:NUDIX domain-containing protein [Candidatus Micrarchaeota archaeon]